jgi:hypothetical protein
MEVHEASGSNWKLEDSFAGLGDGLHVLDVGLAQVSDVGLDLHQAHDDL